MSYFLNELKAFADRLGPGDLLVISLSLVLVVIAPFVLKRLLPSDASVRFVRWCTRVFRGFNVLVLAIYGYYYLYVPAEGENVFVKAMAIIVTVYIAYVLSHLMRSWIFRQYGKRREMNGKVSYSETYQTRLFRLLSNIMIFLVAMITIVRQLGFESLLETGGVLGILGVMIALTQGAWAPDVISGLIILNSDMFEEGDVVDLGNGLVGTVFKTKIFHTEILNLTNNHRIMMKNSLLRECTIHNLSKFASARGLRECLRFKIGYDVPVSQVKDLFDKAFERAVAENICFESQFDYELRVLDTGDHAIEWGFLYHVKQVGQLVTIRRALREVILLTSQDVGISLATPYTHSADVQTHQSVLATGHFE